jgi:hypothetical protein
MKNYIYILIVLVLTLTINKNVFSAIKKPIENKYSSFNPPQDTLRAYLISLNLSTFTGKAVDSMLIKIPANYNFIQILPGDQMKKAHFLSIKYSNGISIGIFVKNFRYMNPNPPSSNWSLIQFKKEDINRIEIFDGVSCINGCY